VRTGTGVSVSDWKIDDPTQHNIEKYAGGFSRVEEIIDKQTKIRIYALVNL
jgi:hypothetical protein